MPRDLSRELQIMQRVFVCVDMRKREREHLCAPPFVSGLLFIYMSACVCVNSPLYSF